MTYDQMIDAAAQRHMESQDDDNEYRGNCEVCGKEVDVIVVEDDCAECDECGTAVFEWWKL